jgi:hypothetical protein
MALCQTETCILKAMAMNSSSMKVDVLSSKIAMDMVLTHHYSNRTVGAKRCFGLWTDSDLVGCVVYSQPASYTLCKGVCGDEFKPFVIELARLVVTTKERNAASFLIANSLAKIGDAVVVSYADCNDHVGHVGYVYQATNWTYTGVGTAEPKWAHPKTGEIVSYTRRHIDIKAQAIGLHWTELVKVKQAGKHRYVTFTGSRAFRRNARAALRYPVLPYPKGETRRHEPRQRSSDLFTRSASNS